MPFFIKGKRKKESGGKDTGNKSLQRNIKSKSNKKFKESAGYDNEEIDSDFEDNIDATVENNYSYSSESEVEETAQEKRLRLAHKYLEEIEKEEKKRLETEEIDKSVITQRLKEEVLEQAGKLRKTVADLYTGVGEPQVMRCKEHSRSITCLIISQDNKNIYSSSDDFNIVKWSLDEKKKLKVIKRTDDKGHKKKILALAISSDNKFLASGDKDAKLIIWNPECMTFIHNFTGHKIDVAGLAFRKGSHQLFSCSSDKTVKIWNLDEMSYVETLYGHLSSITSIDALTRDRAITAGGRDNTIRIWKVVEESHLILNGHKESIDCVKLLNEDHFVSGGDGGNVCLWSSMKKKPVYTFPVAHGMDPNSNTPNWIVSVATYLHTDMFATGSYNGIVNVYKCNEKLKTFSKIFEVNLEGNINCLNFTSDGRFLVAGVGQEHRMGRWHTRKSVKNSIVLLPLVKKAS